ncbi:hydrogen peroxide-inducible genes activator (plasmid) [Azospirillum baldaniorum]|uniref:OxyR n=2 Tax=Azospirillum TaxID=191 RepID=Q3I6K0_AZOBR|nr:hydrogen peroxide-inducible genes activator [Azospirillum baldaniorum]TWA75813.1 transcriptional regulator [Azospirillum brasilense]AAY88876.1 OxyR [Azospirillum baldaniorum]AWJ92410.1 hydrogen peroxide-inducible genes activator [Azospirillum baldaniorum]NUB06255.1 LysR family transcriptional regulator [Azospirillum baldaniorum]CCD00945.1 transcriptional regulator of oxidative stress [Azospirillum baldaniorum]
MKPLPTLRQLHYLVAVVDRCHFGKAAEACLVSQSTLSAGIQELENLLGAPLLERTRRTVLPTPLGREIADRARTVLKGAEELVDMARSVEDPMSGPLHLGVIPTIGPFLIPRVMPALRDSFPKLKLFLREDQTARLLDRLESGELDAAILALPYPSGDVESIDIAEDRFSVVCTPEHRLSDVTTPRPSDVALDDLLLLEDGHCLRDHALAACSMEGARQSAAFQGTSLHTLVQMVANGLGVTLLPQMALDSGILRGLDVVVRPLGGERPFRRIGLVWRRTSGRKETFRQLAAALKTEMSRDSGPQAPANGDASVRTAA